MDLHFEVFGWKITGDAGSNKQVVYQDRDGVFYLEVCEIFRCQSRIQFLQAGLSYVL